MAEPRPNGVGESGIPTGLNRIRTRIEPSNSGDSNIHNDTSVSRTRVKQNQRSLGKGLGKLQSSKEGLRKGKRIARWFSSHLFRDSSSAIDDNTSDTVYRNAKIKAFDKEGPSRKLHKVERPATRKQTSQLITSSNKMPEAFKAFSHELGPKGGIRPVPPRAHSFSDLKELLRSFHSKFNAAKELVNTELAFFKWEMIDLSETNDTLSPEGQKLIEDLLILAQECIEMSSIEFRTKCETIVQDLTDKRQLCQTGLLKWLLTRMLFILTRCTRLLHFEKQSEYVNEKSFNKFKECLERLPSYETGWVLNPGIADFDSGYALAPKCDTEYKLQDKKGACDLPKETRHRSELLVKKSDPMLENDVMVTERHSSSEDYETGVLPNIRHIDDVDGNATSESYKKQECGSLDEQQTSSDGHDLVICRICEELVPTSHLESHSYICAYADKCDIQTSDVNERLLKLAEILEQIIDSRNLSTHATYDSPDSRTQVASSASISEGCSPKVIEWRNKGVEGMFEDIHEMDTACIEDSSIISIVNPKGFNGPKLNHGGPLSATGSMTSASSTNTPRAGSFDFFWLEHNHPSELEDLQQMTDLMDIAHCAAGTDISEIGSHEFLLACMQDLQDILQNSKLKSLVIDTFGHRIENLLREKYIIACDLVDTNSGKSDIGLPRLLENAYQNSPVSTPPHSLHKERTSIEDFEIIKPISRGAYGKVFLARKRTTGDLFAIKVLKKMDMLRKNDIERIVAERNILITVRNPFVVRFFYSFTSRDNLYLVMEYLNGGDLFSLLRNVGCLSEDAARIYVAELVLALEYLHSLGIVHRDLKPDNILVAHDGHIKLTDFGLSKIGLMNSTGDMAGPETNGILHSDGGHDQLNVDRSERSAVGTPDYLAPEILLGTEHGYAADWWSVGVILFELIAGIPPFTADHPERIFDNILNMKIPWPPVPSDMSYEAQDLIRRFLVHDPNQRLGAHGASEVKEHPFFRGVNWNTLALQKAAFVPQPDGVDDTSYFVSRHNHSSSGVVDYQECSDDAASDTTELCSNTGLEKMDECGDLPELESPHYDLSWINFSFKNLSQLASINHDVLVQNGKDLSRSSSPHKGPNL